MFIAIRERLEDREEGFTLIELLVVVIIIGILAAIAIPTFLRQRERAWEKAAQSDLRNNAVIAEEYFNDNGTYVGLGTGDMKNSPDVTMNVVAAATTAERYCISAAHAQLDPVVWYLDSDAGTPSTTACV